MGISVDTSASSGISAEVKTRHRWHRHPRVRSGDELTLGEKAADRLRNSMGSWPFVFGSLIFLAIWMAGNANNGFDKYPFILLNLLLSCLGAMQGAILLIAAKRSDQVASELAEHDYEQDCRSERMLEQLSEEFAALRKQHADLHRHVQVMMTSLGCAPAGGTDVFDGTAGGSVSPAVAPEKAAKTAETGKAGKAGKD